MDVKQMATAQAGMHLHGFFGKLPVNEGKPLSGH